jgi:hypothetical protein
MSWRSHAVLASALLGLAGCKSCHRTPEPSAVDAGATDAGEPVVTTPARDDDPRIDEALKAARPTLNACYRSARKRDPMVTGRVIFRVTIKADGHPGEIARQGDIQIDPELIGCARVALTRVTFTPPPGGQPMNILVPIDFVSPKEPDAGAP